MEIKIKLVGPPGCGKSIMTRELRAFFSNRDPNFNCFSDEIEVVFEESNSEDAAEVSETYRYKANRETDPCFDEVKL